MAVEVKLTVNGPQWRWRERLDPNMRAVPGLKMVGARDYRKSV
jgi:hypothetical protein